MKDMTTPPSVQLQHNQRDTGIELLRIISMFLIVAHHFSLHGGWTFEEISFNSSLIQVLALGGKVGVDIFVLITGYYSLNSAFSFKKTVRLLVQISFYSITLYVISVLLKAQAFSLDNVLYAVFPELGGHYWFATAYLLLMCVKPFINAGIKNISQKQHGFLILLFFVVWSVLPNTIGQVFYYDLAKESDLGLFVFLYLLGAYLKLYPIKFLKNKRMTTVLLLLSVAIFIASSLLSPYLISFVDDLPVILKMVRRIAMVLANRAATAIMPLIIASLSIATFLQVKIKPNKALYAVASSTFGIYLIHDNNMIRRFLWDNICKTSDYQNLSPINFIGYSVAVIVSVFVLCSVIDIIRKKLVEKPFFNIVERFMKKITE